MTAELWQLLIKIGQRDPHERLTCHECFAVLELLAQAASLGIDSQRLQKWARDHLAQCPDCRQRLQELVEQLLESEA
ncbi:MAG: hypothetical protein R3300_04935 [Candidatus Promineifilaceae bacterium]|nr:hypothetical protein [Candidatus Promineifilaceae bacterium]